MARTQDRGKRGRAQRDWDEKVAGPSVDPEEGIVEADDSGKIKPLRPDKAWLKANRKEEEE